MEKRREGVSFTVLILIFVIRMTLIIFDRNHYHITSSGTSTALFEKEADSNLGIPEFSMFNDSLLGLQST